MQARQGCLFRLHFLTIAIWLLVPTLSVSAGVPAAGFRETDVATGLFQPTSIALLPDGRLLITQQGGQLLASDGSTTKLLATIPVCGNKEFGLLGIAVDPNFAVTGYVCLYRSLGNNCLSTVRTRQPDRSR